MRTRPVRERNSTLEVPAYLPGYVAFADDSGDQAFVLSLDAADRRVYQVDVGAMTAADLEPVASDLDSWLRILTSGKMS
jgi:hypothetical protein